MDNIDLVSLPTNEILKPVKKYKTGYTAEIYNLFHIGRLNILKRAKEQCEFLIVGVNTDELVVEYKNKKPVIPSSKRLTAS